MQRRDALKLLAIGALPAAQLGASSAADISGDDVTTEVANDSIDDITAAITAVLRETEVIWNSQDTARLRELWDTGDPEPFYLAGEQENWFIGWDAINGYLAPSGRKVTEAIRVKFYDIHARLLAPDLAFAAYWMRTDMKVVFAPKPFGSDNRVSAVFRRKPEGWRYVCYTEAFQAPTIYMQKLFEKDISPDYDVFYQDIKNKSG